MGLGGGPFEGPCGLVVGFDEGCDVGLELAERVEGPSPKRLACQDREPDLDLIQPGCSRRRKMEMPVRMTFQPAIAVRLVSIQIVEDDMNLAALMLGDDTVHEVEKLDAPAPLALAARDLASGDVESGKKRRHAVPDVIVRLARQRPAVRHFQATLRALLLLVDFVAPCNFARRLKTLNGLTPYEFICKRWTTEPERFRLSPLQQMPRPDR